jgi:DNA-binding transcriptional MerR regulator
MDNLVPIGRFSKICRLSISSLRYYDELGLLRPALVDPDSSYRYYRLSQVRVAETIRLLRALEMPLDEVRAYLQEDDAGAVRDLLNRHQRRMEERVEEGQRILSYLRRLQGGDEDPGTSTSPVRARQMEALEVFCLHACVPEHEVSGTWRALASELQSHLRRYHGNGSVPVGAIFPDPAHNENAVNMTVFVPIPEGLGGMAPKGRIEVGRVEGGLAATIIHLGPYPLLNRSYGQLVSWMQRHGHEAAGPPREIFRVGPTEVADPNSYETEVIWPILPDSP